MDGNLRMVARSNVSMPASVSCDVGGGTAFEKVGSWCSSAEPILGCRTASDCVAYLHSSRGGVKRAWWWGWCQQDVLQLDK